MKNFIFPAALTALCLLSCRSEAVPQDPAQDPSAPDPLPLVEVASMISALPMEAAQLREVHDAASASSGNGYDEEYTMRNLLEAPGAGVGDGPAARANASSRYPVPLRALIAEYLASRPSAPILRHFARRSGADEVQACLDALSASDIQIYWPYSEDWDGATFPLVTFDPGYGASSNYAYELRRTESGLVVADSVYVDENVARSRPVWVINRNSDSAFTPAEFFERGSVHPKEQEAPARAGQGRMLSLKSFKMLRNYDSWFAGASEFVVKIGGVNGFRASTEAELQLYSPTVTDFVIVVRRKELGLELPMQSVLLTDFTDGLDKLAFLITEDDGGTWTSWKCSAAVKLQSKSYGFEIDLPYRDKDDIVWRGQLDASYFLRSKTVTGRFGDVMATFELE